MQRTKGIMMCSSSFGHKSGEVWTPSSLHVLSREDVEWSEGYCQMV